jgi:transmembrane sensor
MNNQEEEKLKKLLQKHLAGKTSPEEEAFIADWYENLDSRQPNKLISVQELERRQAKNWAALHARLPELKQGEKSPAVKTPVVKPKLKPSLWIGVAAVMLLVLGIKLYAVRYPEGLTSPFLAHLKQQNNTAAVQRVTLPDGTLVWLQPGAGIRYPAKFTAATRDIQVRGKAFLVVARDPQHPFRVYGAAMALKVLGTSFEVDFDAGKQAGVVSVRTGKVAVTPAEQNLLAYLHLIRPAREPLMLQPDEKAQFQASARNLVKGKIKPGYWQQQIPDADLTFSDTRLEQVIRQLEDQYKVAIGFENPRLKNCTLTARFHDQPIEIKLEMICKSIGAQYKSVHDKFLIFGAGCDQ